MEDLAQMVDPNPGDDSLNESVVRRLPFGFSKRFGVLVVPGTSSPVKLLCRDDASPQSLLEARRVVGLPVVFEKTDAAHFDVQLSRAYENNSGEAMQMVEGLGDDMDLASLADSVPETGDLLEQEDDAPIIRLINALLTEAVKQDASDIHIETFEKRLIVRLRTDGILREVVQPKRALAPLLVSRI